MSHKFLLYLSLKAAYRNKTRNRKKSLTPWLGPSNAGCSPSNALCSQRPNLVQEICITGVCNDSAAAQPFQSFVFWAAANLRARTRESADAAFKAESSSGDNVRVVDAGPFRSVGSSAFLQIRLSSSLWVVSLMISTCYKIACKPQSSKDFR